MISDAPAEKAVANLARAGREKSDLVMASTGDGTVWRGSMVPYWQERPQSGHDRAKRSAPNDLICASS